MKQLRSVCANCGFEHRHHKAGDDYIGPKGLCPPSKTYPTKNGLIDTSLSAAERFWGESTGSLFYVGGLDQWVEDKGPVLETKKVSYRCIMYKFIIVLVFFLSALGSTAKAQEASLFLSTQLMSVGVENSRVVSDETGESLVNETRDGFNLGGPNLKIGVGIRDYVVLALLFEGGYTSSSDTGVFGAGPYIEFLLSSGNVVAYIPFYLVNGSYIGQDISTTTAGTGVGLHLFVNEHVAFDPCFRFQYSHVSIENRPVYGENIAGTFNFGLSAWL